MPELLLLVGAGLLIGIPLAWYGAPLWLREFAYNVGLQWWMFALPAGLSLLIASITVNLHAIRTAVANPVDALRYE